MKTYLIISLLIIIKVCSAQSPEKISYQAVIRDASNNLLVNQNVGIRISVLLSNATGTPVMIETHSSSTNDNGLISLEIGTGSQVTGELSTIDWGNGPYFIKTETDPNGGSDYTISSTSQLLSVPYALHCKTAESISGSNNTQNLNSVLNEGNDAGQLDIVNTGSIGVGTDTPKPGAAIEIESTTQALLLSRMTTNQRDVMQAEAGMIIYNTTEKKVQAAIESSPVIDQEYETSQVQLANAGQSFKAGMTGDLTAIRIGTSSSISGTLTIYDGEGTNGTLLTTQSISLSSGYNYIELNIPVPIISGQQYTFITDLPLFYSSIFGTYSDGQAYSGGAPFVENSDLDFKTYVGGNGGIEWVDLH